jgi:predicted dehydrogenase
MTPGLKESEHPKIRTAVVGVGYLGKFHAEKYAAMADVELVGVADTDVQQGRKIADQFETRFFSNYQELIGLVDAVSVVVPTQYHYAVSGDFLHAGVDLLIEKPITMHLAEADALIQLADQKGCILQVGHLERFNPAVKALDGIVHEPRFIESHRLSIFKNRGTDVSVVLDLMIHDIDIIMNFVHAPIRTIHAAGIAVVSKHVDIANARLEFENGCVANVTASRISAKNERKIRLFQKDTYVSVDFANRGITLVRPDRDNADGVIPGMTIEQHTFEQADALDDELRSFICSVRQRSRPQVTGQMGRDALRIALDIMNQIKQGNGQMVA